MNVTVGAMFRDSTPYLDRTLSQYAALEDVLGECGIAVSFVFAEGDSSDNTGSLLAEWLGGRDGCLVPRGDGCPYFPSFPSPERWRHLGWVADGVLENIPESCDRFLWAEADLVWEPDTALRLLTHLGSVDAVGAMNMKKDGRFYDTFGTRIGGVWFQHDPPHHPALVGWDGLIEVDSVGGMVALRGHVARGTRNGAGGYVGWCENIRAKGWGLYLDPHARVEHP